MNITTRKDARIPNKTTHDLIIEAADRLFFQQGYGHTSFSDIADSVGISRGNFYYHFKSKDEILNAVIESRIASTQQMLDAWAAEAKSPVDRIRKFIDMLVANQTKIMKSGCPVGTLCVELAKLDHACRDRANHLFTLFRAWLCRQFEQLGFEEDADAKAMHLLVHSQGIATLTNAFDDKHFIEQQVALMYDWVAEQAARAEITATHAGHASLDQST